MALPTLVYFVSDNDRNLWIALTKDVEIALMNDERRLGKRLDVVRIEQFDTIHTAIARVRAIRKMTKSRRRRIVERDNPSWRRVAVTLVSPTGDPMREGMVLGELPGEAPPRGGGFLGGGPSGGVSASADAKTFPPE